LWSGSAREILRRRFNVAIGAFSYGSCFTPGQFRDGTEVGRYVSIGPGVRAYTRNHPTQTLSTHPFFFNSALGIVDSDTIPFGRLVIGHDAWLGSNVVVTPACKRIGIGAVIAAGTLLTRNVPDFAVVGGNPGEFLRFRFSASLKRAILDSRWWELPPGRLQMFLPEMTAALPWEAERYLPILGRIGTVPR
jgi:acetyltransferase-like isoleucine patch superfamily enzyme